MQPLVFDAYFRPQVWGARRLERLGKPLPPDGTFGEAWEISGHPHHVSRIAEGPLRGRSLAQVCVEQGEALWGRAAAEAGRFPLLVKFLDCHELLSVQVHPTDQVAAELLGDEQGKTEAWVVLEAEPTARIYAGLKPGVTRRDLERHCARGTVAECLHAFTPRRGDCVFLPAGTVHAVGGGVLIAEVQQTSDATFRLFDWNRAGLDGRPRALHLEQSLRSIDWSAGPVRPVSGVPQTDVPSGVVGECLVRCPYFELDRYRLTAPLPCGPGPSIGIVLDGAATLRTAAGYRRVFRAGETVLIPAAADGGTWMPADRTRPATLLSVGIPRAGHAAAAEPRRRAA